MAFIKLQKINGGVFAYQNANTPLFFILLFYRQAFLHHRL